MTYGLEAPTKAVEREKAHQKAEWQQDITYRDSLRHAHFLDSLKRLYTPKK